jgi:hypothetical protein
LERLAPTGCPVGSHIIEQSIFVTVRGAPAMFLLATMDEYQLENGIVMPFFKELPP